MEDFSRREFFKKFIPKFESNIEDIPLPEAKNDSTEWPTLSRRSFLEFLGAMGAVMTLEQISVKTAEAHETKGVEKNSQAEKQEPILQEASTTESKAMPQTLEAEQGNKNSLTETAIEQSLMMAAQYIAIAIVEKLKLNRGLKSLSDEEIIEYLRDQSVSSLLAGGVLQPIVEEALFRAIPSAFIDKNDKGNRWEIGIPTSLLFALAHNFKQEESGELQFVKLVPISQFMSGLFYWYLIREKGYTHAALAHSMNNAIPLSIGILLCKAYPKEKSSKIARKILGLKKIDKISGKKLSPS